MAGPSASTINFGNLIAPDVASQQLQLQRQQQLVDLLRQQSITPTPTETAGGMAVRQSPLGGVSKMLSAYLAGQRQKDIDEKSLGLNREMAQRYAQILGGGLPGSASGDASTAPSAPIDSNALAALSQGAAAGSVGPTVANAQRMDSMPPADTGPQASSAPQVTSAPQQGPAPQAQAPLQSAPPGSTNFNLANLLRGSVVSQLGGEPAGAAYWKQYEPTDATKMATAAGSDPVAANAAALRRAVFMTPTNLRPGGGAVDYNNIDPATGQPRIITMPAQPAPGTINMPTPGTPSGFTNVPVNSALPNIAAAAGAESGGKAAGKAPFEVPISLPMSDGRTLSLSRTEYVAYQQTGQLPARYSGVQPNAAPATAPAPSAPPNVPGPAAVPPGAPPLNRAQFNATPLARTQAATAPDPSILQSELAKAQGRLTTAQTPDDQQRAQNDIAAVQREMAKLRPNPAGPTAPSTGAAPVVGMTPDLGQATFQEGQAKDASNRASATRTLAADSPTRVNVYDNILSLSQAGVNTGPGAAWQNQVKGYIANTPFLAPLTKNWKDDVSGFQELNKFLYQNAQRNWQAAGGTGTDSQLEAFSHSSPNDKMFPQALQAMAQWGKGGELAVQGKAAAQDAWLAKNGDNAKQQQAFENAWRSNFAPELFQLRAMNPQGQQAFVANLKTANPQGYAALMAKAQQLKAMGAM